MYLLARCTLFSKMAQAAFTTHIVTPFEGGARSTRVLPPYVCSLISASPMLPGITPGWTLRLRDIHF
jgi:hypothetical protein